MIAALLIALAAGVAQAPGNPQLDFANGLFHRGFHKEAIEEYEAFLKANPAAPEASAAWHRLGESAYSAGQYEKALAAFDQVLAGTADEATKQQAALSRAEVLCFLKRYDEAKAALTPLTAEAQPKESRGRALYYLGKAQRESGAVEDASATFRKLAEGMPDSPLAPYARYQLAYVLLDKNDLEKAALEFSAIANSQADSGLRVECRYRAAEAYDKLGWASAALGAYEKLRTEFPDSAYARRADYGYAWALYHEGKYPEAATAASAFVKANPESPYRPGMDYLLANCLQQQKRFDEALALYQTLRKEHADSEFAWRAQYKGAWALYMKGDVAAAKKEITAFLQEHKDSDLVGDAGFLLGTILMAEGNYEDANQEFRLVADKYAGSEFGVESLYRAAECLAQLGLADQAAGVFEEFVKKYPDSPLAGQAILRAGDAQFNASSFEQAVAKYKSILEKPGDPTVEQDTLYRLAITFHNMKNYEESIKTFQALLTKHPGGPHTAEGHFRIAEHLLRDKGDPVAAIPEYEAAMQPDPKGDFAGQALRGLALARYEHKDFEEAAALFTRVINEFPAVTLNEEAYAWLGQHYFDGQKWPEAAQAFEAMLKGVPDYPNPERIRFLIAECSEKAGQPAEAIARYQAVIDTAPASGKAAEAKFRMAQLYEGQKEVEKAFALYEQAANTNAGEVAARAHFRLAELYEGKNEWDKAARGYMRVAILFLHPELSPESLWRAGQCFEKAGNAEQAKKAYDELAADYAEHANAAKAKEALAKLAPK